MNCLVVVLKFDILIFVICFVSISQILRDLGFLLVFRCFPLVHVTMCGCTVFSVVWFSV